MEPALWVEGWNYPTSWPLGKGEGQEVESPAANNLISHAHEMESLYRPQRPEFRKFAGLWLCGNLERVVCLERAQKLRSPSHIILPYESPLVVPGFCPFIRNPSFSKLNVFCQFCEQLYPTNWAQVGGHWNFWSIASWLEALVTTWTCDCYVK